MASALSEPVSRETVLGIVFVAAGVLAMTSVGERPPAFWVCCAIAVGVLALSRQRLALIGAALGLVAIGLLIAAVTTRRMTAFAAAVVAGGVWRGVLWLSDRSERMKLLALVEGRSCPQCGRAVEPSSVVRTVRDGNEQGPLTALHRCSCGEYTMFDASGTAQHVDAQVPTDAAV